MGLGHVRSGELVVRQQKTGAQLTLPIRPELQAILDATPSGHMTFLVTTKGGQYSANDLGEQFRNWCTKARLPRECTFHGLRATGCTQLADAGCGAHQIAAWSGHMTLKEVERYTRAANQRRLARSAIARQAETGTSSG
jgi:integrase